MTHWFVRGGPVMWPLLVLSLLALTVAVERGLFWLRERRRTPRAILDDFLKQVQVMQKGASMQAMLGKLGGSGMSQDQLKEGQKKLEKYADYIKFMDDEERNEPSILIDEANGARMGQPVGYGIDQACVSAWSSTRWKPGKQGKQAIGVTGIPMKCTLKAID